MIRLVHYPEEIAEIYGMLEATPRLIRPFSQAESRYQSNIMTLINALYKGRISLMDAITQLRKLVRSGLKIAWNEGAEEAGAKTKRQRLESDLQLQQIIQNDLGFTVRLMMDIEDAKAQNATHAQLTPLGIDEPEGKSLNSFLARGAVWANRFRMTAIVGLVTVGTWLAKTGVLPKMPNAMWRLGIAEHCDSCVSLAGTVKPMDQWFASGILPRVPGATYLDCRGYNCQCRLQRTAERITRRILRPLSRVGVNIGG